MAGSWVQTRLQRGTKNRDTTLKIKISLKSISKVAAVQIYFLVKIKRQKRFFWKKTNIFTVATS